MSTDKCAYPKCGKELIHVEGRKKKKYCGADCRMRHWKELHPLPRKRQNKISLPDDYMNWQSVGIIDKNGKVEELKDISQLPEVFQLGIMAMKSLTPEETKKAVDKFIKPKSKEEIPRLPNENALDYRIRCEEINSKK